MARSTQWRIYYHFSWVQLATVLAVLLMNYPIGQFSVAVDHS